MRFMILASLARSGQESRKLLRCVSRRRQRLRWGALNPFLGKGRAIHVA
jgi:hypothetical protein